VHPLDTIPQLAASTLELVGFTLQTIGEPVGVSVVHGQELPQGLRDHTAEYLDQRSGSTGSYPTMRRK
jgi:hypothetical protein